MDLGVPEHKLIRVVSLWALAVFDFVLGFQPSFRAVFIGDGNDLGFSLTACRSD